MARTLMLNVLLLLSLVLLSSLPVHAGLLRAVELYNARSYGEAFREFSVLAQQGNREAQAYLGGMYRDGTGVKQDYAAALNWYLKAADQGLPDAQINLGFLYEKGWGVGQSWPEALRWYRMAAEQGHVQAQTNVGYLLQAGLGANRDDPQALQWFQRATDQGSARGMYYVGKFYAEGRGGLSRNPKAAIEWFRRSEQAAAGSPVEYERNNQQAARQEREVLEREMAAGSSGVGGALPVPSSSAAPAARPAAPTVSGTGAAGASGRPVVGGPVPVEPISQWKLFESKNSGLAVRHPDGWRVEDRGRGAFRISGPDRTNALVVVQPIENMLGTSVEVVQTVGRLLPDALPNPTVSSPRSLPENSNVAHAGIRYVRAGHRCVGSVLGIKAGSRGMLYAISSEESAWPLVAPAMKQMLKSFHYTGSNMPAQLPRMVEWVEPTERAFSLPVPAGWPVEGGLKRVTALDLRSEVRAQSPDGSIYLQIGDLNLPPMVLPSRKYLAFTQEGNWTSLQGVQPVFILRYFPGVHYLTDYYLPQRLGAFQPVQRRDLSDMAQLLAAQWRAMGVPVRVDAGEVVCSVSTNSGPRKAYWTAQTKLTAGLPGMDADEGNWQVDFLAGYLCAPEVEPLAQALLGQMITGQRFNLQWVQAEQQLQARVGQIITQGNAAINDMIARHQHERVQIMDRAYGHLTRSIRGETLVRDPSTGAEGVVSNQGNFYWKVRGTNEAIASDSPAPPLINQSIDRMDVVN
jgi:hypothetical protein